MSSNISGTSQPSYLLFNIGNRINEIDKLLNNGKVLENDLYEHEQFYAMYRDNQAYKDTPAKDQIKSALSDYLIQINRLKKKFEATKLKIRKASSHLHSKSSVEKLLLLTHNQRYDYTHTPKIVSDTNQALFIKIFANQQQKKLQNHRTKKNPLQKNVTGQDCKNNQPAEFIDGSLLLKHNPQYDHTHFHYPTVSSFLSFQELSEYEKFQHQNNLQLNQRRITHHPDSNVNEIEQSPNNVGSAQLKEVKEAAERFKNLSFKQCSESSTENSDGYILVDGKPVKSPNIKIKEGLIPTPPTSGCSLQ